MKYRDILQFDPITDVIQLDKLESSDYRDDIIKSFVLAGIDITMNQYNKLGKK